MRIKSMEFYKVLNTQLFISSHTQKNKSATKYDKPSPQYVEANLYVWYF